MPHKTKEARREYGERRRKRLLAENPEAFRAMMAAYARAHYRRNAAALCARQRDLTARGETANAARAQRVKLSGWYVRRCLVQRGWSVQAITWAMETPDVLELIRKQIELKRAVRNGNQQSV